MTARKIHGREIKARENVFFFVHSPQGQASNELWSAVDLGAAVVCTLASNTRASQWQRPQRL